jgi:integrase
MRTKADKCGPKKRHASGTTYPKSDLRYWRSRIYKPVSGKGITSNHFMVKFQYCGRRMAFGLHTASGEEAALKAKVMYQDLVANGWEFVLDKYRPKPPTPAALTGLTLGEYVNLVRSKNLIPDKTLAGYAMRLRQIVAEIKGIKPSSKRFGPSGKGRAEWLAKVDAVPLAAISPDDIREWKRRVQARAGNNNLKRQQISISVNSTLRQARSLFGMRKILKHLPQVPRPLPFDGIEFEPRVNMKFYGGGINAPDLVRRALDQLDTEELKAFLLAIGLGLRRREADHLLWTSFDFAGSTVRIHPTEHYELKTSESAAVLMLDPEFMVLFRRWHAQAMGPFVLESDRPPRGNVSYHYYRADETFNALVAWLREQGVRGDKPYHTLRKMFGSLIAETHGIHAASSALRHTSIEMTSSVYADRTVKVASGLGSVLSGASVTELPKQTNAARKERHHAKKDLTGFPVS